MTSVLGFPLGEAVERLTQEGCAVKTVEVRSKKGVATGNDERVIRQTETGSGEITLYYSVFQTEPNENNA